MVIHLTAGFLPAARRLATRMRPIPETGPGVSSATGQATRRLCLALHRMGVYHAPEVALRAVGFYPAFSPLPQRPFERATAVCFL